MTPAAARGTQAASPGRDPMLAVAGLVAGYDEAVPIVNGASLTASAGEIVVVLGPNGAGKSTLIKAIAGLVPVSSGTVRLAAEDITRLAAHLMVRRGLAFVPQTENVFARMSVEDNLRLCGHVLEPRLKPARMEEVYAFFPDLARQRRILAGRLSGGQRQMVAVARALMVAPKVLMLDEPSAGLSPKLVEMVFAKLDEIRKSGIAVVLVEQNARAALAIGDRAYVLVEGRERHQGPARELQNDPALARHYLGLGGAP
jgi:branched-chain amino acid transport system ATP-binding protein